MKSSLSVWALLVLCAPWLGAQSLGEAAAKERERRKNTPPAKVYTDTDVRTAAPASPEGEGEGTAAGDRAAGDKAAGEAGATKDEKSPEEQRAQAEKAWRDELGKLDAEIARLDAEVARLEAQASDTRGYMYGGRRAVALENLEKARADRTAARQKRDDLLETGRRQGLRAP